MLQRFNRTMLMHHLKHGTTAAPSGAMMDEDYASMLATVGGPDEGNMVSQMQSLVCCEVHPASSSVHPQLQRTTVTLTISQMKTNCMPACYSGMNSRFQQRLKTRTDSKMISMQFSRVTWTNINQRHHHGRMTKTKCKRKWKHQCGKHNQYNAWSYHRSMQHRQQ